MMNLAEQAEIKRQFCYEHNVELDIVIEGMIKKIRILHNKITFTEEDLTLAEEMLGFVVCFLPEEIYPFRIDVLKNQLWKAIDRSVPNKLVNPSTGKLQSNYLFHENF